MFTGIIEELGSIHAVTPNATGMRIGIDCAAVLADVSIGASIAVNGCCLTVVDVGNRGWAADAQPETLARTTLGTLAPGDPVNLERPVRVADRLGGHIVQGHVDGVGHVQARVSEPDGSERMTIAPPSDLLRYVVEKGSVTVDGVSLTVTEVGTESFAVALIPHTLAVTTLGFRESGSGVNLEVDVLAKYVERLLVPPTRSLA